MDDLRTDPLGGWTVRVAPERARRPVDPELAGEDAAAARPAPTAHPGLTGPSADESADTGEAGAAGRSADPAGADPAACPFCHGGEDGLAEILDEVPAHGPPDLWAARAVRNRYPFLAPGEGVQEVLVDTPRHGVTLATMGPGERREALFLYRRRLGARRREHPDWEAHLFRNQGRAAGSSRAHPHGQLVLLRGSSPGRRRLESGLRAHHQETGRCLLCAAEAARGPDLDTVLQGHPVHSGPHFTAHVLHAPRDPCHLRVVPRAHGPSFALATDAAVGALAHLLGRLAAAVSARLGHEEHNLLFHDHGPDAAPLHWHLEFRPRVTRTAGFEQMAGVGVCPSDPAHDAQALRALLEAPRAG